MNYRRKGAGFIKRWYNEIMNAKVQKFSGWILLVAGLIIIGWSLYSSFNIFTAKTAAPEIFKIEKKVIEAPTQGKIPTTPAELQKEMEKMISQQLKGLLPVEILPKLLNLISWSIFAGILIFAGSQISSLGIKLMKK